jgi:hypothetical protein
MHCLTFFLAQSQVMARFFLNPSALGFYNTLKGKYPTSNMEGDGQQTGGVFVISPEGKLLYSFKEGNHEPSMTKLVGRGSNRQASLWSHADFTLLGEVVCYFCWHMSRSWPFVKVKNCII